jgi:uncharacterized membrane protein YqjE
VRERDQFGAPGPRTDGVPRTTGAADAEPSIGELLKRLTSDTSDLVRQEVNLARTELRQAGGTLAEGGTKIGIGAGLALAGVLALTAFLILALGDLLNNYWLSALIVGVVLLGVGGAMARGAIADVKRRGVLPTESVASLREDAAWAKQESREVKRELTR